MVSQTGYDDNEIELKEDEQKERKVYDFPSEY